MRFIKVFVVMLTGSLLFVFFGGLRLFDIGGGLYAATAAFAAAAAWIVTVFLAQSDRIEALEKQVKELGNRIDRQEKDEVR